MSWLDEDKLSKITGRMNIFHKNLCEEHFYSVFVREDHRKWRQIEIIWIKKYIKFVEMISKWQLARWDHEMGSSEWVQLDGME